MHIRKMISGLVLGVVLATSLSSHAYAANPFGSTSTCKFVYEQGHIGRDGFTALGNKVSTNVILQGDANCHRDFVVASFKIPHETFTPYPLEKQTLYDYKVLKNVGPGTYKVTVKVPNCWHQVDLAWGTNPTGPGGHLPYEAGRMINAYVGGDHRCVEEPTVIPPVTPPVTPPTTPAPTVPAKLPVTGPSSVLNTAIFVSVVAGGAHYLYNRRLLRK